MTENSEGVAYDEKSTKAEGGLDTLDLEDDFHDILGSRALMKKVKYASTLDVYTVLCAYTRTFRGLPLRRSLRTPTHFAFVSVRPIRSSSKEREISPKSAKW